MPNPITYGVRTLSLFLRCFAVYLIHYYYKSFFLLWLLSILTNLHTLLISSTKRPASKVSQWRHRDRSIRQGAGASVVMVSLLRERRAQDGWSHSSIPLGRQGRPSVEFNKAAPAWVLVISLPSGRTRLGRNHRFMWAGSTLIGE